MTTPDWPSREPILPSIRRLRARVRRRKRPPPIRRADYFDLPVSEASRLSTDSPLRAIADTLPRDWRLLFAPLPDKGIALIALPLEVTKEQSDWVRALVRYMANHFLSPLQF